MEAESTISIEKDKYERDSKRIKKESKEKESNKKKYDKKSGKYCFVICILNIIIIVIFV